MYPAAYSLFFMVGFPANCLSLYASWMLARSGSSTAVYLVNLSVSDLLYTVSLPAWVELALRRPAGAALRSSLAAIMYNSFYVGSGLLCCISVDRCLAVVHPLRFHWVREVRTATLASAAVWALEIAVHVALLAHAGALQAFPAPHSLEERVPMAREAAAVALARVSLGFLVPVSVMAVCFWRIMRSLRRSSSVVAGERRKVGLLLLLLLLTYVGAFLPYQAVMLLRAVLEPGSCAWAARLRDPYLVTVATTTLNSTLDPIIYCLISESAQAEVRKAIERGRGALCRRKCSASSTGINSVS